MTALGGSPLQAQRFSNQSILGILRFQEHFTALAVNYVWRPARAINRKRIERDQFSAHRAALI
jgi:hypothetical protein